MRLFEKETVSTEATRLNLSEVKTMRIRVTDVELNKEIRQIAANSPHSIEEIGMELLRLGLKAMKESEQE